MIAPHRFGAHPRQQQTRQGAVGQFVAATSHHVERVWPVDALELVPIFWVGARQRAEREQPRHEAQIGVRFARGDELRHLVELREVSRLAAAITAGWHRDVGQVDGNIADRNKPTAVLLFVFAHRGPSVIKGPGTPHATPARGVAPRSDPRASCARLRGRALSRTSRANC